MLPALAASSALQPSNPLNKVLTYGAILGILALAYIFWKRQNDKAQEEKEEKQKEADAQQVYDDANVTTTDNGAVAAMARKLYSEINESSGFADDQRIIRLGRQVGDLKAVTEAYEKISKGKILDRELNRIMSPQEVQEFYANVKMHGDRGYSSDGKKNVERYAYGDDYNLKLAQWAIFVLEPDDFIRNVDHHKAITIGYAIYNSTLFYQKFREESKRQFGESYDFLTVSKNTLLDIEFDELAKAIEANRYTNPI